MLLQIFDSAVSVTKLIGGLKMVQEFVGLEVFEESS